MTKSKGTRRPATTRVKTSGADVEGETAKAVELVVCAFRLTEEERDAIHNAAGPARASMFARTLLVAAARNDAGAVKAIMVGVSNPE